MSFGSGMKRIDIGNVEIEIFFFFFEMGFIKRVKRNYYHYFFCCEISESPDRWHNEVMNR